MNSLSSDQVGVPSTEDQHSSGVKKQGQMSLNESVLSPAPLRLSSETVKLSAS